MATPFKMKAGKEGPMKKNFKSASSKKTTKEEKVVESRGKNSITKTKGGKSSTYNKTSSKKNRDGSTTNVYTNDLGNTETRNVS